MSPEEVLIEQDIKRYVKGLAAIQELVEKYHLLPSSLEIIQNKTNDLNLAKQTPEQKILIKKRRRKLVVALRGQIATSLASYRGETLVYFENDIENLIKGIISFEKFMDVYGFNIEVIEEFIYEKKMYSEAVRDKNIAKAKELHDKLVILVKRGVHGYNDQQYQKFKDNYIRGIWTIDQLYKVVPTLETSAVLRINAAKNAYLDAVSTESAQALNLYEKTSKLIDDASNFTEELKQADQDIIIPEEPERKAEEDKYNEEKKFEEKYPLPESPLYDPSEEPLPEDEEEVGKVENPIPDEAKEEEKEDKKEESKEVVEARDREADLVREPPFIELKIPEGDMKEKVLYIFKEFISEDVIKRIGWEIRQPLYKKDGTIRKTKTGSNFPHPSQTVLEHIKKATRGKKFSKCKNSEFRCIPQVITTVYKNPDDEKYMDEILPFIRDLYQKGLFPAPNTQAQAFTTFNQAMGKAWKNHPKLEAWRKIMRPLRAVFMLRQKNREAKTYQDNTNILEFSDNFVLQKIQQYKTSDRWEHWWFAVALAIGSRGVEIFRRSCYAIGESATYCTVTGVAKDRPSDIGNRAPIETQEEWKRYNDNKHEIDWPNGIRQRIFQKPVIGMTARELLDLVSKLRQYISRDKGYYLGIDPNGNQTNLDGKRNVSNEELPKQVGTALRKLLKEEWNNKKIVLHSLRALYAELAWIGFAPSGYSKTAYYAKVLGHKETSLTTALSYQKFAIRRNLAETPKAFSMKLTEIESLVLTLVDKFKKQSIPFKAKELRIVIFKDRDGNYHEFKKIPYSDKVDRKTQLIEAVNALDKLNINPSYTNLHKLGFGTELITKMRQEPLDETDIEMKQQAEEQKEEKKEEKKQEEEQEQELQLLKFKGRPRKRKVIVLDQDE